MKKELTIVLLLFIGLIGCDERITNQYLPLYGGIDAPVNDSSSFKGQVLYSSDSSIFKNRIWQGIPTIEQANNGDLFVAWYSGGKGEGVGNYITLSQSADSGKTWKNDVVIVQPLGNRRFFDPCLFKDKFDNVYLAWSEGVSNVSYSSMYKTWCSVIRTSSKGQIKLDSPTLVAPGIMLNKPVHLSDGNTILFPISYWNQGNIAGRDFAQPWIYSAQYVNTRISRVTPVGYISVSNVLRTFDEHMVVQLNNDSFIASIRTTDGLYMSTSNDSKTWYPIKKSTELGKSAASKSVLLKFKDETLAIVYNNNTLRKDLKIGLSNDLGKTWKSSFLIDDRLEVSYPDCIQDNRKVIYVVYDYNRFNEGQICLAKLFLNASYDKLLKVERSIINKIK